MCFAAGDGDQSSTHKAYVLFEMLFLSTRLLLISSGCDGGEVREQSEFLMDQD